MDNFQLGKEKVVEGIVKATSLIEGTYGAAGGNVIVEHELAPGFIITNDGKTIVDSLKLVDPYEALGAKVIKEAGERADKDSGDGRKTTMLLTKAIFKESANRGVLPMDIKRSLDATVPLILASLDKQTDPIDLDQVGVVASISSESEVIGQKIQEAYKEIGNTGFIEVEPSNLPETYYEIGEGVKLRNAGYFGEYFLTEQGKAVYKRPKILIAKDRIGSVDQIEPIFKSLKSQGINELVIYFDEMDMSVAGKLAFTYLQGGFKTILIKAPVLWKDWLFEDFAKITGATIVDNKEGKTFKNFAITDLGTCDKIIITKDETRVVGIKDVSDYVAELTARGTDEAKLRASWLNTKVAVLKVGADSETDVAYKFKKAKDASHASYLALKEGVVAGGGVALLNVINDLVKPDNTIGEKIMIDVLKYPILQIMKNYGVQDAGSMLERFKDNDGFDAKKGVVTDMVLAGIIDPVLVIKNAVKNAVSIASTTSTITGATIIPKTNEDKRNMPYMQ